MVRDQRRETPARVPRVAPPAPDHDTETLTGRTPTPLEAVLVMGYTVLGSEEGRSNTQRVVTWRKLKGPGMVS